MNVLPERLKVLIIVHNIRGGAMASIASRLAEALLLAGAEVVLAHPGAYDVNPALVPSGTRVINLRTGRVHRSLKAMIHAIRVEQPDWVITFPTNVNIFGILLKFTMQMERRWTSRLLITHTHPLREGHENNWKDNKWVAKFLYRFADASIAHSPYTRQEAIRWCGLDVNSVATIPPPLPAISIPQDPEPHPWLTDKAQPTFVSVGRLSKEKRYPNLVNAFLPLAQSGRARLLIIGHGPQEFMLREHIERLGIEGSVKVLGFVDDVFPYLTRAFAFVLASAEEGYGQVIVEAMSASCPVICCDAAGGGPRFITDFGKYADLLPVDDELALTTAMTRMVEDRHHRDHLSRIGYERSKDFLPAAIGDQLMSFFKNV